MKVAVILRQVPDVVEELVIAEDGRTLSEVDVRYVTNELDDCALEQALILKGRRGARVTAFGVGGSEARDALATSAAKGADEAVFVPLGFQDRGDSHRLAAHLLAPLKEGGYGLVLTGVQAPDEVDGALGGVLASLLGAPYVGGVAAADVDAGWTKAVVRKEYPGGRVGVMELTTPAVLGIQASEQPPRYVPVSKVMQARKALQAREVRAPVPDVRGAWVTKLLKPEVGARAKMLEGDEGQVATALAALLKERGLL
jgi:electron transfer flavoprotein beta subunit